MKDISLSENSDHHILNFKSDRNHSDSSVRKEREINEVTHANISITPESIGKLQKMHKTLITKKKKKKYKYNLNSRESGNQF